MARNNKATIRDDSGRVLVVWNNNLHGIVDCHWKVNTEHWIYDLRCLSTGELYLGIKHNEIKLANIIDYMKLKRKGSVQ